MALRPGENYINSPVRLYVNFQTSAGIDTDPATVTLKLRAPCGIETSYVFLTDAALQQTDAGDYTCDVTPDEAGRWFYRWETTGTGTTAVKEGTFTVQNSVFYDTWNTDYAV